MKKLNLLEPKIITGFLNDGAGEKVKYLQIANELDVKALEKDVEAGAIQFKDSLDAVKKGLSRVVVVRATNEEDGLMAVNYLAGIVNHENRELYNDETEDSLSDTIDWCEIDFDYTDYDDEDEDSDVWEESPCKIPVVDIQEIQRYGDNVHNVFQSDFIMAGRPNMRNQKPYWMSCTKESMCVVVNLHNFLFHGDDLTGTLERFQKNRRLYVVVIDSEFEFIVENDNYSGSWIEQLIFKFALETTADVVMAKAKENQLEKYRLLQFENWANELDMTFEKRFAKKNIVESIVKLNNREKSKLFKMVLKYIKKESNKKDGEPFGKEDFDILKKFRVLGLNMDDSKSSRDNLDKDLIGMEKVKEQVKNIVEVMKYNKHREKMGLSRSDFHNVHLLIGAPGTAKTTVAKMMGNMMCEENLLPGSRFICVNGADLKGLYVGHSAPKTHQIFENHDIIVIDEAYSLASNDGGELDSFSQEAIAQLIIEIEEHSKDKLILFAGYGGVNVSQKDNKMKRFIDANPGLKSRINSTIYFESYTAKQMVDIVHVQAGLQKLTIDKKADEIIYKYFEQRVDDRNFGNGREARSLVENALLYTASRVMKLAENKRTKAVMNTITYEDVSKAIEKMKEANTQQTGKEKGNCGFRIA